MEHTQPCIITTILTERQCMKSYKIPRLSLRDETQQPAPLPWIPDPAISLRLWLLLCVRVRVTNAVALH